MSRALLQGGLVLGHDWLPGDRVLLHKPEPWQRAVTSDKCVVSIVTKTPVAFALSLTLCTW